MATSLVRPLRDFFRILFPDLCCHCGEALVGDERYLCTTCMAHIAWASDAGQPGNSVEQRLLGRIPVEAAAALMTFQKGTVVQDIVHQIKYHGNDGMAHQYGHLLGVALERSGRFQHIDGIVPVPLHRRKKYERGYNQSELLAEAIAKVLHCPVEARNLYRTRYTDTQTHKNRLDRMDNMDNVFAVRHPEAWEGKHLLLVDDILTTGATTEACYHALKAVPGLRISVAVLALVGL